MQQTDYERRGYLHEDFRLFHLSSALAEDTAFHYHEFHKLVFFLAGRGNYIVEGRTHVLRPYDVVLVRQGAIHKAQIDPSQRYERVILYISPEFLRAQSTAASQLDACFRLPADGQSFVLRPEAGRRAALLRTLDALEEEERSTAYGHDLLARAQMLQLLVMLGRGLDDDGVNYAPSEHCNEKTAAILEYLNTHLTEDVSIEGKELWITVYEDLTYELSYEDPDKAVEDVTVHAQVPADWADPSCWAWSAPDGTNAFASWPGEALTKDGDWYSIQVPGWINSVIINANEGAVQTTDLSVEAGKEVWVVVTDAENAQVFYEAPAQDAAATEPAAETTVPASTEAPQEAAKSSNTGVIVGVAAAVVLLGGGAAIVAKKKKS